MRLSKTGFVFAHTNCSGDVSHQARQKIRCFDATQYPFANKQPAIEISQQDARERGIASGDEVRVYNDRGECYLTARISTRVKPGVAVAPSIWWKKLSPDRNNVNATTSQELTDLGGGACFYDNLVQISPRM